MGTISIMPQIAVNKKTGERRILVNGQLKPFNEEQFQREYGFLSRELGLNPNPDDPKHHYDYRTALAAGVNPLNSPDGHWPSEFKTPDHPNRYIVQGQDVIDSITGKPAKTAINKKTGERMYFDEHQKKLMPAPRKGIQPIRTLKEGTKDVTRNTLNFELGSEQNRDLSKEAIAFNGQEQPMTGDPKIDRIRQSFVRKPPTAAMVTPQARADIGQSISTGGTPEEGLKQGQQQMISDVKKALSAKWLKPDGSLRRPDGWTGYIQDVIRTAPQIGAQILVTAGTGPVGGTVFMGSQISGGQYEQLIKEGVPPERAFKASVANAMAQAPLEAIGMNKAFKIWQPGKTFGQILKSGGEAGFTEFVTEWIQKYPELAADIWAKGEKLSDQEKMDKFMEGLWKATKEGWYEGLVATPFGVFGGATVGYGKNSNRSTNQNTNINQTNSEETNKTKTIVLPEIEQQAKNILSNGTDVTLRAINRLNKDITDFSNLLNNSTELESKAAELETTPEELTTSLTEQIDKANQLRQRLNEELNISEPVQDQLVQDQLVQDQPAQPLPKEALPQQMPQPKSAQESAEVFQEIFNKPSPARDSAEVFQEAGMLDPTELQARKQNQQIIDRTIFSQDKNIDIPTAAQQEILRNEQVRQEILNQLPKTVEEQIKEDDVNLNPSEAQKEAGNYKKASVKIDGLKIKIENPNGSIRSGRDENGNEWTSQMVGHYGYFERTEGKDGDQVDVFIKPNTNSSPQIYIVDQVNPKTGKFDEHKVVLGANSEQEAKSLYMSNYEDGWQGFGAIKEMTQPEFKTWLNDGKRNKKPVALSEKPKTSPFKDEQQVVNYSPEQINALKGTLITLNKKLIDAHEAYIENVQKQEDIGKLLDCLAG